MMDTTKFVVGPVAPRYCGSTYHNKLISWAYSQFCPKFKTKQPQAHKDYGCATSHVENYTSYCLSGPSGGQGSHEMCGQNGRFSTSCGRMHLFLLFVEMRDNY